MWVPLVSCLVRKEAEEEAKKAHTERERDAYDRGKREGLRGETRKVRAPRQAAAGSPPPPLHFEMEKRASFKLNIAQQVKIKECGERRERERGGGARRPRRSVGWWWRVDAATRGIS